MASPSWGRTEMLKARANNLLLFGLSEENIRRLKLGKPISIDCHELGYEIRVVIVYGVTEEAIAQELEEAGFLARKDD